MLTMPALLGLAPAMARVPAPQPMLDLRKAVVVAPAALGPRGRLAARMLVEAVEARTRIRWPVVGSRPAGSRPVIELAVETRRLGRLRSLFGDAWMRPEGYALSTAVPASQPGAHIVGRDSRGLLYGVGRLLRTLRLDRDSVTLPAGLRVASAPRMPLRGHQLGYRPKTNSYDGWNLALWEQYLRDLVVFGANAVELIPPRSDDDADSPHFPVPPMEMMVRMARLAGRYGLDVWVWHPALDKDYTDPKTVALSLKEWDAVYRRLPRVDAVFVPGGDPGKTPPAILLNLLERQIARVRRRHPRAQLWVSPQGFTQAWMDEFLDILRTQRPRWLTGVVFGPQVRTPLPELRRLVPRQYPLRHYPDITHTMQCQFPAENWDVALALTEGREPINPRPMAMAAICRWHQPHTIGSITYSEGCNDDVNKAVWSALEWDPSTSVEEVVREYARYFLGPEVEEEAARGILALEANWQGPLAENSRVVETLRSFQGLERRAPPRLRLNWRFQQLLYRAYYDAWVQARLLHERAAEQECLARLAAARERGSEAALREAERALESGALPEELLAWRARVFELAEALFQSVRMQLSVPRCQAIETWRGANLDTIDHPLNNAAWLRRQFAEIRAVPAESARLERIQRLARWADPGPGGFYDDLADPERRPHLLPGAAFEQDPGHMRSVRIGFEEDDVERLEWARFAETLYDTPLRMRWEGLSPASSWRIRVVYGPNNPQIRIRLTAATGVEVHGWIEKPRPNRPLEFDIPAGAVRDGVLELAWTREPGLGGNGRGCQVSEVWLLRR